MMIPLFLALLVVFTNAEDISQQIVNGEVATQHRWPWQLSLQTSSHICGAVLVSEYYAITAAHCVNEDSPGSYRVKCGGHNIHINEDSRNAYQVAQIVRHPLYNTGSSAFANDIAVLRLASPVEINNFCKPAVLASPGDDYGGSPGVITGWGRMRGGGPLPSRLKKGFIELLTRPDCKTRWGVNVHDDFHMCVKDVGNQKYGACNGDSGGPAHDEDGKVLGLASFVASGCLTYYPSVYVRVSYYRDWIDATMAAMG